MIISATSNRMSVLSVSEIPIWLLTKDEEVMSDFVSAGSAYGAGVLYFFKKVG
jgi:hypothetical protein